MQSDASCKYREFTLKDLYPYDFEYEIALHTYIKLRNRTEKDKDAMKRDAEDARASMDALSRDKVRMYNCVFCFSFICIYKNITQKSIIIAI